MTTNPQNASRQPGSTPLGRVLVVDDETGLTDALVEMLTRQGYEAVGFNDGRQALAAIEARRFDPERRFEILLADLMMPEMDGLTLLKSALALDPHLVCALMTGQGTVQTAVEAMKIGAFDYILKPFKLNTILATLRRAIDVRQLRQENVQLREMVNLYELGRRISASLDLAEILQQTCRAALEVCEADEASILLPAAPGEHGEDHLTVAHACNGGREQIVGQTVPVTGTVGGWVAANLETMTIAGPLDLARFPASRPRGEITHSLALPMALGDRLVGVIHVNRTKQAAAFTPGQVRSLGVLANVAAAAMENARLFRQTELQLRRLAALRTIDLAISSSLDLRVSLSIVLDQATAQLGVEMAAVLLANPQSQLLVFAAGRGFSNSQVERLQTFVGVGCAGEAALERKTIAIPDLTQEQIVDPLLEALRQTETVAAMFAAPLVAKGEVKGVLVLFRPTPFYPDRDWLHFFETLAGQAAIAIDGANLFEILQRTNQQLVLAYNTTIEGWSRALDLRDRETEGHTQRVTAMTLKLARAMGIFDDEDLVHIRRGALLHDIGKMGIPDEILHKPDELDPAEEAVMRKHPEYVYELLYPIAYLRKSLDIPYYHHERWDGTGYPLGLAGEQIPLAARIFAVVDVWDALRSNRPYRPGWPDERVAAFLKEQAGHHFDPQVVERFLVLLTEEGE